MENITLRKWYSATGRFRVILLVAALSGKIVQYSVDPPLFIFNEALIASPKLLLVLHLVWAFFTSIIVVECFRTLFFHRTFSWNLTRHFAFVTVIGAVLVVYTNLVLFAKTSIRYHNYGWSLAQKKEYAQAMRSLDIATYYDPENLNAYLEKGYVQRELGNHGDSLASFDKVLEKNTRSADAYAGRGITYYYLGDRQRALHDWEKAVTIDPNMSGRLDRWIKKAKTER